MSDKMNPEIKERWVAALRSGEYQQTAEVLHDDNGFCCLGVLCDLYRAEHNMHDWDEQELRKSEDQEVPSRRVTRWAGLGTDDNPAIKLEGFSQCVSNWNDNGRTFAEIADAIEEQL